MPFPVVPEFLDDRGLFIVQEPGIRARILPLFKFDPRYPEDRPVGQGTAFRIDPWGCCATAFHVIEDMVVADADGRSVLRDDVRLNALDVPILPYGQMQLASDAWTPFRGLYSINSLDRQPFQPPRVRNVTELAVTWLEHSTESHDLFFPVDCRWRPQVGERLMAIGYAELDEDHYSRGEDRSMTLDLYGSEGVITEIVPSNFESTRPWPIVRVAANWPGGMSGGPVFNEGGNVVGLVSMGFQGEVLSSAVVFSGSSAAAATFATVDSLNAGRLLCWVGIDENGQVIAATRRREELVVHPAADTIRDVIYASFDPVRQEYMPA